LCTRGDNGAQREAMRRIYGREIEGHNNENSMKSKLKICDLSKLQRRRFREDAPIHLEIRALSDKDMLRIS